MTTDKELDDLRRELQRRSNTMKQTNIGRTKARVQPEPDYDAEALALIDRLEAEIAMLRQRVLEQSAAYHTAFKDSSDWQRKHDAVVRDADARRKVMAAEIDQLTAKVALQAATTEAIQVSRRGIWDENERLRAALERLLSKCPSAEALSAIDDDEFSGRRVCPINTLTIADIRAARLALEPVPASVERAE